MRALDRVVLVHYARMEVLPERASVPPPPRPIPDHGEVDLLTRSGRYSVQSEYTAS